MGSQEGVLVQWEGTHKVQRGSCLHQLFDEIPGGGMEEVVKNACKECI